MDLTNLVDLSDLEDNGDDVNAAEYETYPRTEELEIM
jgi:hypothetical protein